MVLISGHLPSSLICHSISCFKPNLSQSFFEPSFFSDVLIERTIPLCERQMNTSHNLSTIRPGLFVLNLSHDFLPTVIMACHLMTNTVLFTLQYTLSTFTEWRGTKWQAEAYSGGELDGPDNGLPPGDWEMEVEPDEEFKTHKKSVKVPHTETVLVRFIHFPRHFEGEKNMNTNCIYRLKLRGPAGLNIVIPHNHRNP